MKKNVIAIMLSMVITLSLVACGSQDSNTGNSSGNQTETTEQTTLTIAARGGSHVDAINAVKESFEKDNNVRIEILGLESADLKEKISLDSKNKNGSYDLIMADDPWMPELSEAGIFAKLSDYGIKDDSDFVKTTLDLGKHPYATGELFALPFSGNVQLFFYNKEIFEANKLEIPDSWESVLSIASTINGKDQKVGYVIRGQQGNPIVSDFLPIFWAYGGKVFDENWSATVNSEAGIEALNMYTKLLANGVNYEKADIVSSVSEGAAAMSLGWPSWYITGETASAEYASIPSKGSSVDSANSTGMIGNWMMGVTSNSTNKELAAKFLTFVTSSEIQKKMVEFGGVPTRTSVYNDSELVGKYKYFPTLHDALANSVARPRTPKWSEVETAFGTELSAAIAGIKSVEQALEDATIAINEIMK